MMTMMMMQRLLQNNNNNNNNSNSNNNNNGYADETRLNGIRHHSASPFSKPAAVQAAGTGAASDSGGEPDASQQQSSAAGNEQQPSACSITATAVQTGTCATSAAATAATTVRQQAADIADDRLSSDEDDELNVDEDPVDLTNNRLHGCGQLLQSDNKACTTASATTVPMMMDTTASDYETCSSGAPSCNKGRLAFSVENILDPNKFTKKLIAPAAVLPRWRPRVDFTADPSIVGEFFVFFFLELSFFKAYYI